MTVKLTGYYRDTYCDDLFGEDNNFTWFSDDIVITIPPMKDATASIAEYIIEDDSAKQQIIDFLVKSEQIWDDTETEQWVWRCGNAPSGQEAIFIDEKVDEGKLECQFILNITDSE